MGALDEVLNGFPALLFTAGEHGWDPAEVARGRAQVVQAARAELDQLRTQLAALEQQRAELEALNLAGAQEPGSPPAADTYAWLLRQSALARQIAAHWRHYGADPAWNLHGLLPTSLLAVLDALEQPIEEDGHAGP